MNIDGRGLGLNFLLGTMRSVIRNKDGSGDGSSILGVSRGILEIRLLGGVCSVGFGLLEESISVLALLVISDNAICRDCLSEDRSLASILICLKYVGLLDESEIDWLKTGM